MFAVVTRVRIDPSAVEAGPQRLQEQVVPVVKQSPGFVEGHWTIDREAGKGYAMVLFETEQDARNQLENLKRNAEEGPFPGVTWENMAVAEVIAEAKR